MARYYPRSDSWNGITDEVWDEIKDAADRNIDKGLSYNYEYTGNIQELASLYPAESSAVQYKAIIETLESGIWSPGEMLEHLESQSEATRQFAHGQDPRMGADMWDERDPDVPEELYGYHGVE